MPQLRRAIEDLIDPIVPMQRVVDQCLALVPAAQGATVELADDDELIYVCGAGSLGRHVGMRVRLASSLSGTAYRDGGTVLCEDARVDERVDTEACLRVGAVSMVCIPLSRDGERFGVLKVTAPVPSAFSAADAEVLTRLAAFIGATLAGAAEMARITSSLLGEDERSQPLSVGEHTGSTEAAVRAFVADVLRPGLAAEVEARTQVERVLLNARAINTVFQPLVDLQTGHLVGAEALSRFNAIPAQPPDAWFAQAERVGAGVELELAAAEQALRAVSGLPPTMYLTVNVGPATIITPQLAELVGRAGAERIVLELTEHVEVPDYPALQRALRELRAAGTRLAVDDAGAGFASLGRILKLAPDIIKIDRELIDGIDLDPVRRALARALVGLAAETGASVIAEGLENDAQLEVVRDLGIAYGQGYLLGRPAPLSALGLMADHGRFRRTAAASGRR